MGIPGNIHKAEYRDYWMKVLQPSPYVAQVLAEGYRLPLSHEPDISFLSNNQSALRQPLFVTQELAALLEAGAIEVVQKQPTVVLPMSVVFSNKLRLVIDSSRNLNDFLVVPKVKLSGLAEACKAVERGDFQTVLDMASSYYHISIFEGHRQYLGIHWEGVFYRWKVLFLGLCTAVVLFTKMTRPMIAHAHRFGIRTSIYIDDEWVLGKSKEECGKAHDFVRRMWRQAGFVQRLGKGVDTPTQSAKYLGLICDSANLRFEIPADKLAHIKEKLQQLAGLRRTRVRQAASTYGKLAAVLLATGPQLRLLTRFGCSHIDRYANPRAADGTTSQNWENWAPVTSEWKEEIGLLLRELDSLNGYRMYDEDSRKTAVYSKVVASDASAVGLAAIEVKCGGAVTHTDHPGACGDRTLARRMFTAPELQQSSTHREMLALWELYVRKAGAGMTGDVLHLTDNKGCESIMLKGSPKADLQRLALQIFKAVKGSGITLHVQWRSREDERLELADGQSRDFDLDDWGISDADIQGAETTLSVFCSTDVFASAENRRCGKFITKNADAFTADWRGLGNIWACPPVGLITRTIRHVVTCQAKGVLVIPLWRAASYWHMVCQDGRNLNGVFSAKLEWHPLLHSADYIDSDQFRGVARFAMLALVFDGAKPHPFVSVRGPGREVV